MNRVKVGKSGRETPILDPQLIRECLTALRAEATEFPIKVEGTSTLPYASTALALDWDQGQFILKLVRPLPHELALGAIFRMIFTVAGQRYEALITFRGREAYLQYRFELPKEFFHSDRRRDRRLPFRPRESTYIIAQSGTLAGLGVAGPLANIGMGGLALRVDRILRLEDQMRLPLHSGALDVGLVFDRLRIQDLPRLPLLEIRGRVAHLTPKGSELILGLEFEGLGEEESLALHDCLTFREKVSRRSGLSAQAGGAEPSPRDSAPESSNEEGPTPEAEEAPELEEADSPLRILQRRTTRLGLVMAASEGREGVLNLLRQHGYYRIELARDLGQAKALWGPEGSRPRLLILDLPHTAPQTIENLLATLGAITGVILSDATDASLMVGLGSRTRVLPVLPRSGEEEEHWIRTVDGLAEIVD